MNQRPLGSLLMSIELMLLLWFPYKMLPHTWYPYHSNFLKNYNLQKRSY